MLDENEVSKNNTGSSFTSIGTYVPSPSQTMLAYTVEWEKSDTVGSLYGCARRAGGVQHSAHNCPGALAG